MGNISSEEDRWRANTSLQKQRNCAMPIIKKEEKIEFVKWAKDFDAHPFGYIELIRNNYNLPEGIMAQALALGYVSDISEVKRLHNEQNIQVNWTKVPYGITQEEWDNPDSINDTLYDVSGANNLN